MPIAFQQISQLELARNTQPLFTRRNQNYKTVDPWLVVRKLGRMKLLKMLGNLLKK
jgi:hypothetical protein